jgi:hypothetical protein
MERLPLRGFKASEHQLRKSFEWFESRLRDYLKKEAGDNGKAIATLVETLCDRLFFTVIYVTDELNAYKVFETLNARGVRLSATDLLKNHLFFVLHRSESHEQELEALESRWEQLVGRLGIESFPDFLRIYWNSHNPLVRQSDLFKVVRKHVADRETAFQLLRDLENDVEAYLNLTQPEGGNWSPELQKFAATLKLFHVRQPYSVLLAAYRTFAPLEFEKLFRAIVAVSFRYNVIGGGSTAEQERTYAQIAQGISREEIRTAAAAIQFLAPIYPSDEAFRAAFTDKSIRTTDTRNNRVVRYILCEIEKHISKTDPDHRSQLLSVEHIFPQNPEEGWDQFGDSRAEAMADRLGNMTLLSTGTNRDIGTAAYSAKREVYRSSPYAITSQVSSKYDDWTPEDLIDRQEWMAKQATAIWKISQL